MSSITDPPPLDYADDRTSEWSFAGISLAGWVTIGAVFLLMVATFRFNLIRLWGKDNPFTGESEWQHGLLVPLISIYYLYLHKEELLSTPVKPLMAGELDRRRLVGGGVLLGAGVAAYFAGPLVLSSQAEMAALGGELLAAMGFLVLALNWGIGMLVFGLVFFAYGIYPGQNDYFKDLGMLIALFGATLTLCGWKVMRIAWFPIVFLICAIPWPGLVYSKVALPLQQLAAQVAASVLSMSGIDAYHSGSKIFIDKSTPLNVAEACAGLKALMTFITVGGAVAFLSNRALWQKLVITLSAIPIAIFCNVMRVTVQGMFHHFGGAQWSENFAHQFVGMVMLVPAFLLILLVAWILDRLFVEDSDDEALRAATAAAGIVRQAPRDASVAAVAPMASIPVRAVKSNAAVVIRRQATGANAPGAADATKVGTPAVANAAPAAESAPAREAAKVPQAEPSGPVPLSQPVPSLPPTAAPARRRATVAPVFVSPAPASKERT